MHIDYCEKFIDLASEKIGQEKKYYSTASSGSSLIKKRLLDNESNA